MAGNSKACYTALAFLENMEFFNVTPEMISEWFMSKGASGVAAGLHYKETNDKNHAHFLAGWSKSAPDTPGFVALLKECNSEMIAKAKAEGKDVTITLEDGSVVERQLFKIQTGRYAKKHCVYDPEAMEQYLSHSTAQCKKDGKVEYDPDKDVIYTDGFDLDSYLSRDAVQKAKKANEKDDVDVMLDLFEAIDETNITDIIDLAFYLKKIGRRDLLAYMHAHSSIVTQAINGRRYRESYQTISYQERQRCEQAFPHGTNSVDAGEIPPKNDDIPDPGCAAKEAPFADAPADETPAPADADLTCVESKEANSTYAREEAPEDEHSPLPAEGASRKAREADTFETSDIEHVTPEMLKSLKSVRRASSSAVKTSNSSTAEEDLFNDSELEFAELDFDPFV